MVARAQGSKKWSGARCVSERELSSVHVRSWGGGGGSSAFAPTLEESSFLY